MKALYFYKSRNGDKGEPYYTIICLSPELDKFTSDPSGLFIITFTSTDDRNIDKWSVRCTYTFQYNLKFKAESVALVAQHYLDSIRIKNDYDKIQNINLADLIDD